MRVLLQRPWEFTLLEDGVDLVFSASILAQGSMSGQYYSIDIVLTDDEAARYGMSGEAFLDDLHERMNRTPSSFSKRKRADLRDDIGQACITWREAGGADA